MLQNTIAKKIGMLMLLAGVVSISSAKELRILTWGGYVPDELIQRFEAKYPDIEIKVTTSNNEDMIAKLRATGGSGFDLVNPSQDRIKGAQVEYNIYKPLDLSKIDLQKFNPDMLAATQNQTEIDGEFYGVPLTWGTAGLIVNIEKANDVVSYLDLCKPEYAGRVAVRPKRPVLLGVAFAQGNDPFAAYSDKEKYQTIMTQAADTLIACKKNLKTFWESMDDQVALFRSEEIYAADAWDTTGLKLTMQNPDKFRYRPMQTGALGWIDTFALPRKTKAEEEAYLFINFVMEPENAALVADSTGSFTTAVGAEEFMNQDLIKAHKLAFSEEDIKNIKWYPPVPAGLEDFEGTLLDQYQAAQ